MLAEYKPKRQQSKYENADRLNKNVLRDAKSNAIFKIVAEAPSRSYPFALQFMEILEPFLGECIENPNTGEWKVLPSHGKKTKVRYTNSGSTSFSIVSGYEDYDRDDEEHWE